MTAEMKIVQRIYEMLRDLERQIAKLPAAQQLTKERKAETCP